MVPVVVIHIYRLPKLEISAADISYAYAISHLPSRRLRLYWRMVQRQWHELRAETPGG